MTKGSGGLANRLYRGEAGLNIVGRRRLWFSIAGTLLLVALLSLVTRGFELGIDFNGGNEFQIPVQSGSVRVESLDQAQQAVEDAGAEVVTAQEIGSVRGEAQTYSIRTTLMNADEAAAVKADVAERLGIPVESISDNRVSKAWGDQVTQRALTGLVIFVALVMVYLVLRFEWRMAVAAVSSLVLDLVLTAGVYSLIGFEVTPSTVIGFLTILGFALYDVVVVFDKVQENTRSITGNSNQTYGEAANLAVNQTLMRSFNTSLVALLPVGGLLFIGAGLLKASTLKDLGLVLFVGMGVAVYSSLFFATPVLATLKGFEPRIRIHTQRVLARRAAGGDAAPAARTRRQASPARAAASASQEPGAAAEAAELAGSGTATAAPKAGARPAGGKQRSGSRGGRPRGGGRPGGGRSGAKRR